MQVLSLTAQGMQIVLPVNMVAQILGKSSLAETSRADVPSLAGHVNWREFEVPVCHSSELLGLDSAADRDYERLVVLWPMKSAHPRAFLGLTSLTAPRVIDVTEQDAPEQVPNLPFALGYLDVEGELAVIPDIEQLSGLLYPAQS